MAIGDRGSVPFDAFDGHAVSLIRPQAIDSIRMPQKTADIVVADHQDLKAEISAGLVDNLCQARNQIRMQPAVLLIQHQKTPMLFFVQSRNCEHSQAHRHDIRHRASLPLHDVFGMAVPFDVEINAGGIVAESRFGTKDDRLFQNFLQSLREILFDRPQFIPKKVIAEQLQRIGNLLGNGQKFLNAFQFRRQPLMLIPNLIAFAAQPIQTPQTRLR
ncbi:MAG: hypothetical protein R3C49_20440 [Planctomycetaceae bacterium]